MDCVTLDERVVKMLSGEIPNPPSAPIQGKAKMKIRDTPKYLRRVPPRNWAWVHFYIAFAAWSYVLGQHPPGSVSTLQQHPLIDIWTISTMVGALLGVVGLVFEAQGKKWIGFGAALELMGHIAMAISPLIYGVTQIGLIALALQHPETLPAGSLPLDRLHLPFLVYITISALFIRTVVVIPRFRKEATDSRKVV